MTNSSDLNFKSFGEGFPLVILHGLFGSLDNWQGIAKTLASHFKVYILDQRNHGKSFHSNDFNYQILSDDLNAFFIQENINKAHLIGHSMGGKAAMLFAMQHPEKVAKLIIVDVAPVAYEDKHSHIINALLSIQLSSVNKREDAEMQIRDILKNEEEGTIQFLLKGLYRNDENNFEWRFNVTALGNAYSEIAGAIAGEPFEGETLFIKGAKSYYINSANYTSVEQLFPNNELTEISNASHWVHAEKPTEFLEEVKRFIYSR